MSELKLAQNDLVAALLDEMRDALTSLERGDYDLAFDVLQKRCRPTDPLVEFTCSYSLDVTRVGREIVQVAPKELLRAPDLYCLEIMAVNISQLRKSDELASSKVISTVELISDYGILLQSVGTSISESKTQAD